MKNVYLKIFAFSTLFITLLGAVIYSSPLSTDQTTYDIEINIYASTFEFDFIHENGSIYNDSITIYNHVTYLFNFSTYDNGEDGDPDTGHGFDVTDSEGTKSFTATTGTFDAKTVIFTNTGTVDIKCTVVCGPGHGSMTATINVVNNPDVQTVTTTVGGVTNTTTTTVTETNTSNNTIYRTNTLTKTLTEKILPGFGFGIVIWSSFMIISLSKLYIRKSE